MQTNIKEYDESFDLTQALQKKGTKEYGFIHLAQRANGSWVNIPIMLAVGAQDGPTLATTATSMRVLRELSRPLRGWMYPR